MSAFQRKVFVCFVYLYIVSLCITYVKPFVLNGQSEVSSSSSDLLKIAPSDIDNVLKRNGLHSNELVDGMELKFFFIVFFDRARSVSIG